MNKDTALDLALEALENLLYWDNGKPEYDQAREAITAIKQARSVPIEKQDGDEDFKPDWMNYQEGFSAGLLEGKEQIKQALAATVQEPVAWVRLEAWQSGAEWPDDCFTGIPADGLVPLYTTPPAAQPTTEESSAVAAPVQDPDHGDELTIAYMSGVHRGKELAAQRQWVGLDWLPEHKCGLHLSHNEHRDVYETVEQFYDADDFTSKEEWHKAVAEDSVWVLHWYPNTPVGFTRIAASTLEAIEAKLKERNT